MIDMGSIRACGCHGQWSCMKCDMRITEAGVRHHPLPPNSATAAMFGYWPIDLDVPAAKPMPALGSKWKRVRDPWLTRDTADMDHEVTADDIAFWSSPERGAERLRAWHNEWEPVAKAPKSSCTCGGQHVGGTHSNWCDSNPNAPAPFRMPGKLSF